jgi:lipopolysaccharide heptosyltransferase I
LNILIIRLTALGDIIHGLPAAAYLKKTIPNLKLTWLVEPAGAELLAYNSVVDEVIVFEKKRYLGSINKPGAWLATAGDIMNFIKTLQNRKFDAALDLQGLFKSALLASLSGAKRRFGFAKTREAAHIFMSDTLDVGNYFFSDEHIVNLNLKLANFMCRSLGFVQEELNTNLLVEQKFATPLPVISEQSKTKISKLLYADKQPNNLEKIIVLAPGTTWTSKIWDLEKWYELSLKIAKSTNCKIILVGGKSEVDTNEKINAFINKNLPEQFCLNLTEKTSLLDLIALFDLSNIVIGVDTGPLHLASAVSKCEVIGIFGSTPYRRNGPYGLHGHSIALNLSCQPCFEKTCPLSTKACLVELSAETVFSYVKQYLK